ncbi:glycosyltransferase family 4 protein [Novosphingobium tardum]|uniref:Glycosyltransferase family 4 protein n=1 Tax=Novosphingobium tardum TaxID=1538021 RepID=A0ABV8RMF0_9SPHN
MKAQFPARRRRIGFVNSHPIQYFVPLYCRINASEDLEAVPIYLTDHSIRGDFDPGFRQKLTWDIDLLEGTDPVFVAGARKRKLAPGPLRMLAPDVMRAVWRGRLDALVIHGHNFGANHLATIAAKLKGIPVFSRGETHLGLPFSERRLGLRNAIMPRYYSQLDGFLAIGSRNREFYRAMQVPESKIFDFPYTVDNDRMIAQARLEPAERAALRARLSLRDGVPTVLYASKFMARKHPDDLIEAARRLRASGLDLDILMVGAGEMEAELKAQARDLPGAPVIFPGFANQTELPRLFGASDIFVLPSEAEPWGLIVNEAMCGGLPIVASREIGSVADLVVDGENGRVFDAGDVEGLTAALRDLVADPQRRAAMGRASLARIEAWNYDRCVAGLRAALQSAT